MLEPTEKQGSALAELQGTLALVQFLVIKDPDAFGAYRSASRRAVQESGGRRARGVHIDQVLAGGEMPYQTTPFYMMNLNKYYPVASYESGEEIPGEQAYNCYATRILPYLVSVGGYPAIMGHTVGVFVGDESSPLHDDWSDFAMVYYPSRQNFINMMTNTPVKGAHHRDAGLQRAVLMPSSDWA